MSEMNSREQDYTVSSFASIWLHLEPPKTDVDSGLHGETNGCQFLGSKAPVFFKPSSTT